MKNRVKLFISGIVMSAMLLAVVTSYSQNPYVSFNPLTPTTNLSPGATVSVQVVVSSLYNIGSFTILVNFDRTVLTFNNAVLDPALAPTFFPGSFAYNPSYTYPVAPNDVVARIAWLYSPTPPPGVGVPSYPSQSIFTMNFTYNGGATGTKPISFYATNVNPTGSRIQSLPGTYNYSTKWGPGLSIGYNVLTSVAAGGDWNTASTWVENNVPSANFSVIITGNEVTDNTASSVCHDLTINPAGKLTLATGRSLSVEGNMTLQGDAAGTGSFLNNGTLTVTGTSLVQRWVTGSWGSGFPTNTAIWHYVSSPVSDGTIGVFLGSLLNHWNELTNKWDADTLPLSLPLTPAVGYSLAKHVPTGNVTFTGTLNNLASYSPPIANHWSVDVNHGWNLLGNPYPCAIDWDLITARTNVAGAVYTWDGAAKNYVSWNGTTGALAGGILPAEQAFFVQVNSLSAASITIPNSARLHASTMLYKNSVENLLTLRVKGSDETSDAAFIHFRPEATTGFDQEYDAYKLFGSEEAPQLYTITPEATLTINSLPDISTQPVIQMGFKAGLSSTYTLTASDIETFSASSDIVLEDLVAGKVQNLKTNPVYTFAATTADETHRFNVHFSPVGFSDNKTANIKVYSAEKTVYVNIPSDMKGSIVIYNMLGSEIIRTAIQSRSLNKINLNVPTGFYLVKVDGDNASTAGKVFIR